MKAEYAQFSEEETAKMEELTGIPAKAMLEKVGLLPTPPKDAVVLDNACGGGLVAAVLFDAVDKSAVRVVCSDIEEVMVNSTAAKIEKNGWNAEARVADARALPFADDHFTHVLINFGMQVIPDQDSVLKESLRVLKQGGKLGFTVWTEPGWVESMKVGVPGFVPPPMFVSEPLASPEVVTKILTSAGFTAVEVQPIVFDFTDNMGPFFAHMKKVYGELLGGEKGEGYERYMKDRYGEGEFVLTWKACIVTAQK